MIHTWVLLVQQQSQESLTATYRQHKEVRPWLGANLQCISQHTTESAHYPATPARHNFHGNYAYVGLLYDFNRIPQKLRGSKIFLQMERVFHSQVEHLLFYGPGLSDNCRYDGRHFVNDTPLYFFPAHSTAPQKKVRESVSRIKEK